MKICNLTRSAKWAVPKDAVFAKQKVVDERGTSQSFITGHVIVKTIYSANPHEDALIFSSNLGLRTVHLWFCRDFETSFHLV
jgi:hypothetical protein